MLLLVWDQVQRQEQVYGLFSVVALASQIPLYEYTGAPVTTEQADKYPNAYMFSSELYGVLDASRDVCSPAKFVNTKGKVLAENNCEFITHEGNIFLSTIRAIAQGEELFAPYNTETLKMANEFFGGRPGGKDRVIEHDCRLPIRLGNVCGRSLGKAGLMNF